MKTIRTSFGTTILDTMKVPFAGELMPGDGFSSVGARTGAIKLAMAGTQDWWHRFSPLLDY